MPMPIFIEEAKASEKWCPFARSFGTLSAPKNAGEPDTVIAYGSKNRGYQMGGPLHNCMCIGARCMAWRFGRTHTFDQAKTETVYCDDKYGYCGLAGVPG